ncbi:hypothetical protein K431DRAFT_12496 [Polychaeton citri CBS 116435]|uniref:Uncharacterized protein n=1 Tax=Polychaeton citri CBS 116435 TaxID=1314669 RepID=A0A9P4PZD6_9PEZI|nr:hypothetical protein K431DRAFT_12496 [Polychaeton citri CBS 116435]
MLSSFDHRECCDENASSGNDSWYTHLVPFSKRDRRLMHNRERPTIEKGGKLCWGTCCTSGGG